MFAFVLLAAMGDCDGSRAAEAVHAVCAKMQAKRTAVADPWTARVSAPPMPTLAASCPCQGCQCPACRCGAGVNTGVTPQAVAVSPMPALAGMSTPTQQFVQPQASSSPIPSAATFANACPTAWPVASAAAPPTVYYAAPTAYVPPWPHLRLYGQPSGFTGPTFGVAQKPSGFGGGCANGTCRR